MRCIKLVLLLLSGVCATEIARWNEALLVLIANTEMTPPEASRAMAMVHVAQLETLNMIEPMFSGYLDTSSIGSIVGVASKSFAAQGAAHVVLKHLFPDQISQLYLNSIYLKPSNDMEVTGDQIGELVGLAMIANRTDDGSADASAAYTPPEGEELWVPTAPGYNAALLPYWANVRPWVMSSSDQFRSVDGPTRKAQTSAFQREYDEVKALGSKDSKTRTAEQTDIARLWAAGAGTVTPPGQFCQIAAQLSEQKGLDISAEARVFAVLSVALADAAICAWDSKYAFNHWRPITVIRQEDSSWTPLVTTPPFPAYYSGHSTFSGAGAAALIALFDGEDTHDAFSITSAGITRNFTSITAAAEEAGISRIYGGIHWQCDNVDGLAAGESIGKLAAEMRFLSLSDGTAEPQEVSSSTLRAYLAWILAIVSLGFIVVLCHCALYTYRTCRKAAKTQPRYKSMDS